MSDYEENGPWINHGTPENPEWKLLGEGGRIGFGDPDDPDQSPVPALRALYPEVDQALLSAEHRARRAVEKHDGMVTALRELTEDRDRLQGHLKALLAGQQALDDANYWQNKIRTDWDAEDAERMYIAAEKQYHAALDAARG